MSIQVGTVQRLKVIQQIQEGYRLSNGENHVILHHDIEQTPLKVGKLVDVFIYEDQHRNLVASLTIPKVGFDTYDWVEVVDVHSRLGVFVNIGIPKDILVSIDDLPTYKQVWPKSGDKLYVKLGTDRSGRLLAIPATEQVFMNMREAAPNHVLHTKISGYVYHIGGEGSAIFTTEHYRGFIHKTEREQEPRLGEHVIGRVIDVKDDGTINVSLKPLKHERISDDAQIILDYLKAHHGVMPFNDKSHPDDIQTTFNFSKSAFKRALGRLMKEQKVIQKNGKTYLVKE